MALNCYAFFFPVGIIIHGNNWCELCKLGMLITNPDSASSYTDRISDSNYAMSFYDDIESIILYT